MYHKPLFSLPRPLYLASAQVGVLPCFVVAGPFGHAACAEAGAAAGGLVVCSQSYPETLP